MSNQYSVVITTVSSDDDATNLAEVLLSKQLAACVQVVPIKSHYTWKGSLNVDSEQLLMIKAKHSDFSAIQQCIVENHSYEVPEIIEVPITAGFPAYLSWIDEVTK
ncbi:divalent-cation tolerance protein CutA [cf. Phormidesmis sp. LEGE 11477]|uniref:divalent-cation tolerance protein CutA n=1 Tax=cf. Phormidesmis sp. LEGE 11477 TaxID=1828680 RepID=UPI00187E05BA|nr:divalent-cation tolerance protein CutA [cf. Phormidesmis sp. LEGE 11477]MBE9059903.1 divalent-cation tolerance protein CutA [cf. Phormidesmis sp. LEGE 11477]